MLLLLSAIRGSFWGFRIIRSQTYTSCYWFFERSYLKPMAAAQDPDRMQPTYPPLVKQIQGLFKRKLKRIWYICWVNLGKVWEQILAQIKRDPRLSCLFKVLLVYFTRIWCWLYTWKRSAWLQLLWLPQAFDKTIGYQNRSAIPVLG